MASRHSPIRSVPVPENVHAQDLSQSLFGNNFHKTLSLSHGQGLPAAEVRKSANLNIISLLFASVSFSPTDATSGNV